MVETSILVVQIFLVLTNIAVAIIIWKKTSESNKQTQRSADAVERSNQLLRMELQNNLRPLLNIFVNRKSMGTKAEDEREYGKLDVNKQNNHLQVKGYLDNTGKVPARDVIILYAYSDTMFSLEEIFADNGKSLFPEENLHRIEGVIEVNQYKDFDLSLYELQNVPQSRWSVMLWVWYDYLDVKNYYELFVFEFSGYNCITYYRYSNNQIMEILPSDSIPSLVGQLSKGVIEKE